MACTIQRFFDSTNIHSFGEVFCQCPSRNEGAIPDLLTWNLDHPFQKRHDCTTGPQYLFDQAGFSNRLQRESIKGISRVRAKERSIVECGAINRRGDTSHLTEVREVHLSARMDRLLAPQHHVGIDGLRADDAHGAGLEIALLGIPQGVGVMNNRIMLQFRADHVKPNTEKSERLWGIISNNDTERQRRRKNRARILTIHETRERLPELDSPGTENRYSWDTARFHLHWVFEIIPAL